MFCNSCQQNFNTCFTSLWAQQIMCNLECTYSYVWKARACSCKYLHKIWNHYSLVPQAQAPSSLQGPGNETAHSVKQNPTCQDPQLKRAISEKFLFAAVAFRWTCVGQLHCRRQNRLGCSKGSRVNQNGWKSWRKVAYCQWNLYDDGQPFSKPFGLLVLYNFTCILRKFHLWKSGQVKTWPAQLLATAIISVLWLYVE